MSTQSLKDTSSLQIERQGEDGTLSSANRSDAASQPSASSISKVRVRTGRVLTGLVTLFLLFDAVGKLVMPSFVVEACVRLGFPLSLGQSVGILLLICTVLYAIPRTVVFGAILLTGFLGGAVAIQMRAGSPVFETVFPVIFGVLAWAGVYLRDCRLGSLLPFRR
jgi:hypothetical protein